MKDALVAAVLGAFVVCGVIAVQIIVENVKAAKKNKATNISLGHRSALG